jgi:outer membrane protein TolC
MRLVALALVFVSSSAQAKRYTLDELIAKLGRDYPGVVAAREDLGSAEAQSAQAKSLFWPTGEITFGVTGSPSVQCADQSGRIDPDVNLRQHNCITTNTVNLENTAGKLGDILPLHGFAFQLNASLTQPLFTFGKIYWAMDAAEAGKAVARGRIDAVRGDVAVLAARSYWTLKWARAALATLRDAREKLKEWIAKINDAIESGKGNYTETDLIRMKLSLEQVELGVVDVERGEEIALAGLRQLARDTEADVDEEELATAEVAEQPVSFYEDVARVHRPEARLLDSGLKAAHANRQLKLANLLPDIGVRTSFGYSYAQSVDSPTNAFMNQPNSLGASLVVGLRQPLDIALRLAQWDQAKADERAAVARRREALGGIAFDIERAWADAHEARRRSERAAHGEKVARGWYNAVDQALSLGLAESRDLADAARNYFDYRLKHLQSLMDINITLAVLKRAAGL